jgi:hypothetical protein
VTQGSFLWKYCYGIGDEHKLPLFKIVHIASRVADLIDRSMIFNHLLTLYFQKGIHSNVILGDGVACNWNSSQTHYKFVGIRHDGVWYCLWILGSGGSELYFKDTMNNHAEVFKITSQSNTTIKFKN